MPELPEVETIVQELCQSDLIGKKILDVIVFWPRTVAAPNMEVFCSQLKHQVIKNISRRGKFIVLSLNKDILLIHLRMTGKLKLSKEQKSPSSHERLQLRLNDGRFLHYEDQRKFGKWYLLSASDRRLESLGLEPLAKEFTQEAFKQKLRTSSQQIKPFLLNQKHIAGIGNIYADEILWLAKVHPRRKVSSLTHLELKRLYESIPVVLKQGIVHAGTSLGKNKGNYFSLRGNQGKNQDHLNVYRREGLPCPRCQKIISKIVVGQRGTHICTHCQVE